MKLMYNWFSLYLQRYVKVGKFALAYNFISTIIVFIVDVKMKM